MRKVFTKRFFQLGPIDQCAIVNSVICDLVSCIGRHYDPGDDGKAEKQIKRIRRRAVEHEVWPDTIIDERARPTKRGDLPGQMRLWEEQ